MKNNALIRKLGALIASVLLLASPAFSQTLKPTVPTPLAEKGFAVVGTNSLSSVTVGAAGSGYTSLPTAAFSGGYGSVQATATTTLKAVSVNVVNGGTGYVTNDTLRVTASSGVITPMVLTVTATSGVIQSLAVATAGVYTTPVTTSGAATTTLTGSGTGATITVAWGVATVAVVTGGSGYLTAPTMTLSGGGGGSGAGSFTYTLTGATSASAVQFRAYRAMADTVVSAITFPATMQGSGTYAGDTSIIGKTIPAGTELMIYGNSITLASGWGLLVRRSAP